MSTLAKRGSSAAELLRGSSRNSGDRTGEADGPPWLHTILPEAEISCIELMQNLWWLAEKPPEIARVTVGK